MGKEHAQYFSQVDEYFSALPDSAFELAPCPLCGASKGPYTLFKKGTMEVVKCRCEMVYSLRQPTEATLKAFYASSRPMTTWSSIKASPSEDMRQARKFEKAIERIGPKSKTLLDIGCGNGFFLSMIKNQWDSVLAIGVDDNDDALNYAKQQGLEVYKEIPEGVLFDYATFWGLLEHVKDPSKFLDGVKKILKRPGRIIACVPNVESAVVEHLGSQCVTFCPQHLSYFSVNTLTELLTKAGFALKEIYTIENEVTTVAKHKALIPPYQDAPSWIYERKGFRLGPLMGYKIVAFGEISA